MLGEYYNNNNKQTNNNNKMVLNAHARPAKLSEFVTFHLTLDVELWPYHDGAIPQVLFHVTTDCMSDRFHE